MRLPGVQRALHGIGERVTDAQAHEQRARAALHKQRQMFGELFQRAMEQTVGTATHDLIGKLLAELSSTDGERAHEDGVVLPTSIGVPPEIGRAT